MKNLAMKLRTLRDLKNYKQEYVGSYAGLSQSAYSRIENGETENLSLKHVEKFAELYEMSPEQLIGWDGKISIGTVNGVGVNQGTTHLHQPAEERIKELETKVEQLMGLLRAR